MKNPKKSQKSQYNPKKIQKSKKDPRYPKIQKYPRNQIIQKNTQKNPNNS